MIGGQQYGPMTLDEMVKEAEGSEAMLSRFAEALFGR